MSKQHSSLAGLKQAADPAPKPPKSEPKSKKTGPLAEVEGRRVQVNARVPEKLAIRFKQACIADRKEYQAAIIEAMAAWVDKHDS